MADTSAILAQSSHQAKIAKMVIGVRIASAILPAVLTTHLRAFQFEDQDDGHHKLLSVNGFQTDFEDASKERHQQQTD